MEVNMPKLFSPTICGALLFSHAAFSQAIDVKRFNPSEWTKGRFTEMITVNGPGKTIYLAGI